MNANDSSHEKESGIQLDLFTWQSERIAEGWRHLEIFNFEKAEKTFNEVQRQHKDDEECAFALKLCSQWKDIFELSNRKNSSEQTSFLFLQWNEIMFPSAWGPQLFKKTVLNRIIQIARENKVFYISESISVADLLVKAQKHALAEKEILNFFQSNEKSVALQINLANIQWNLNKIKESRLNYLEALLTNPSEIAVEIIENLPLAKIIQKYGSEMAPAWGWMQGELPLFEFDKFKHNISPSQKGLYLYHLLIQAEKLTKQGEIKQIISIRKQLKEMDSDLYTAYFNLLKKRKLV
ncbi:MAG: hypothetical protein WCH34_10280 [Bacteroidota bacterium]